METQKKSAIPEMPQPLGLLPPGRSMTARLWRRLPTIAKIILAVPLFMALLGAEIELRLSPQLDVLLTAVGAWGIWVWLNNGVRLIE